jgi:hypothetical protein
MLGSPGKFRLYSKLAFGVVSLRVTICTELYVPDGTENVGVAVVGIWVKVADATPLLG